MTLKFDSLSLTNFGPFRSIEGLSLNTDSAAPVTVIHGENTLGKTSLFRALRWCLYGSPEATRGPKRNAIDLFEYMNRPAWGNGETEMEVEIAFDANGQHFNLTRRATFTSVGAVKVGVDLRIDATVIHPNDIDSEIGRLLHPQISEFFLFDGELLRDFFDRLNTDRERDLLRSSIENVLGIPALQLAEQDISLLNEDVMTRKTKALKSATDAESARKKLAELKSRQESLDKDQQETEQALRKARSDLEDVKLRIGSVEDLKADAREMEGLEAQIEGAKQEEGQIREMMRTTLSSGWLAPVAGRLQIALKEVQARNDAAQEQTKALRGATDLVELLRNRTEGGVCPTCHQELPVADAETHEHLRKAESALAALQSAAIGGPDLQAERDINDLIDSQTIERLRDQQARLDKVRRDQFERNRRLEGIKDRMKGNDAAKIRQLASEHDRLEKAIEGYEDALKNLKPKRDFVATEQDKLARVLSRLGGGQPDLAAEALFYSYVKSLLTRTIERYQERTRAEVERSASEMLKKLLRDPDGYSGLRIGRDYRVELLGKDGDEIRTSEGGKQLVALSLIGALKLAAVRGGPVVLDSPLARLDREHRANVLQHWVPELGSQAILLVQSGELTEKQATEIMGHQIGHSYRIYRPNNDPQDAAIERIH